MQSISEKTGQLTISRAAVEQLISAHDGDMALLYLYHLATSDNDPERAARALCKTRNEIDNAAEKLQRLCLDFSAVSSTAADAAQPEVTSAVSSHPTAEPLKEETAVVSAPDNLPEYSSEYIVKVADRDPAFVCLLEEAKKVIGRPLSPAEMQMLLGIYEYLGLPAEVIMELLNYCADLYEEKYAGKRRPTGKAIEREAYIWANHEIGSLEQAEEYIAEQKARSSAVAKVAEVIGKGGRSLTQAERQYIDGWLNAGFTADTVKIAYERTMLSAGNFSWRYIDRIIQNWAEKKLFTVSDIEEKDSRPSAARSSKTDSPTIKVDMEGLQKSLNNV